MKKIFALLSLIVLFSSFFPGNYFQNSNSPLGPYEAPFPMITSGADRFLVYFPDEFRPDPLGDAASNKGAFKIWYENGRGGYSTVVENNQRIGRPVTEARYDALMMTSILYENPRRPPGTSARFIINPLAEEDHTTDILEPGSRIRLFSPVPRVVSADPMTLAISYRMNSVKDKLYRIALKYNNAGSQPDKLFRSLREDDSINIPTASPVTGDAGQYEINSHKIPQLRHFGGEEIKFSSGIKASTKTDPLLEQPSEAWNDLLFNDVVFFYLNPKDTLAHNIFITLEPKDYDPALVKENPKVFLEAVLQETEITGKQMITRKEESQVVFTDVETSRIQDMVADAHDPNNVFVTPECLPAGQATTKLHYNVNFENTGNGAANAVLVAFTPPENCTVNMSTINVKNITCGGKNFTVRPVPDSRGRIIFKINGRLEGAQANKKTITSSGTKGNITFDLDVTANNGATVLNAWADIFFHSENGNPLNDMQPGQAEANGFPSETVGFEQPVTTDPARAFFKNKCTNDNGGGNDIHPKHGNFWWLWLLIALAVLIFVAWWVFRKKHNAADGS